MLEKDRIELQAELEAKKGQVAEQREVRLKLEANQKALDLNETESALNKGKVEESLVDYVRSDHQIAETKQALFKNRNNEDSLDESYTLLTNLQKNFFANRNAAIHSGTVNVDNEASKAMKKFIEQELKWIKKHPEAGLSD